jgi:hypothetical protein
MSRLFSTAVLSLIGCLAASAFAQGIVYVNGTTGDDAWDGRCEVWDGATCGPKATTQAGIEAAAEGDHVVIADGIYTGLGNYLFFNYDAGTDKAITVRSASDNPAACLVEGGVDFVDNSHAVTVRGLDLGGAYCSLGGGRLVNCVLAGGDVGVFVQFGGITLINCSITGNSGGGVYCDHYAGAYLLNCLVAGNTAAQGGGVNCDYQSTATLVNCALVGNTAVTGAAIYGAYYSGFDKTSLYNCTICGNNGGGLYACGLYNCINWGNSSTELHLMDYPVGGASYSDIEGGCESGPGNIQDDPLFVSLPSPGLDGVWGTADDDYGNLGLRPNSPCIDAAANTYVPADTYDIDGDDNTAEPLPFDLSGQPRFHDDPSTPDTGSGTPPLVDIGAYEFQGTSYARGDLNCDGSINGYDIDPFVLALTDSAAYSAAFADCDYMLADINGDGAVNGYDIDPFVQCLTGGGCPARP